MPDNFLQCALQFLLMRLVKIHIQLIANSHNNKYYDVIIFQLYKKCKMEHIP